MHVLSTNRNMDTVGDARSGKRRTSDAEYVLHVRVHRGFKRTLRISRKWHKCMFWVHGIVWMLCTAHKAWVVRVVMGEYLGSVLDVRACRCEGYVCAAIRKRCAFLENDVTAHFEHVTLYGFCARRARRVGSCGCTRMSLWCTRAWCAQIENILLLNTS